MESTNLHHQDHQPCPRVGISHDIHAFSSNLILSNPSEGLFRVSSSSQRNDVGCPSWTNSNSHDGQYLENYAKLSDLLNSDNLSRLQEDDGGRTFHASVGANMRSQIHPSVNVSSLRGLPCGFGPGSIDVDLQPLDLFSMDRSSPASECSYTKMKQHPIEPQNPLSNHNNGPKRRPSNNVDPKAPQSVSKRQRVEPHNSCQPLKVRKEKLGDRIATLQQLVAPFGKTDTASVLMEAIGYIKFLHSQVETLSVPYMKLALRHNNSNNRQQAGSRGGDEHNMSKPDLRSQGLCLVPVSCMSYIANDVGGGGMWVPPNFNPGFS